MIYITGDIHGEISRLKPFSKILNKEDTLITLGDFGANYFFNYRDDDFKKKVQKLGINIFTIRGNHEANPAIVDGIKEVDKYGEFGYSENNYPNIFYAKNGKVYEIEGHKFLVLGGAYSVDKFYRMERGWSWFEDEQMTDKEMDKILKKIPYMSFDYILSHTCPKSIEPTFLYLSMVKQDTVDKRTEEFLDEVKKICNYKALFFGHYHGDYQMSDKEFLLFKEYLTIDKNGNINNTESLERTF